MPCQLFAQKMLKLSRNNQNIKMFGVPPNTLPLVIYIGIVLLLGVITLQHVIQNNCAVGLMVVSDGMVHFLKIKKIFYKSTKTILWL